MRSSKCEKLDDKFVFLKEHLAKRTKCPVSKLSELYLKISHFTSRFKEKWYECCRMESRFLHKNKDWLETSIGFPFYEFTPAKEKGRPQKQFEECSDRSKRFKTENLRANYSIPELGYAMKMNFRACGEVQASKLVATITRSPNRASEYNKAYDEYQNRSVTKMSGEEALSVLVEAKLTRHQYNIIRSKNPEKFPSYKTVQATKINCYPNKKDITITAFAAEVTLQALLDHTVERLMVLQKEVISGLQTDKLVNLCLVSKWGFDGSSGHTSYKQRVIGCNADDSSVFISSLVPIRLECGDSPGKNILWQNPRPASTRYCRPIKILFAKETTQLLQSEKNHIEQQIQKLKNSPVTIQDRNLFVAHQLLFTMVDGKVCNALTNTSSTQRCYICGASSRDFNSLERLLAKPLDPSALQFGLSTLHCWIRSFEWLLHVGYKLPIKKWQARNQDKDILKENKVRIQKEFKNRMGLIVDQPKPGFGNSNDGNTARRFFSNAELASDITGVDKVLIQKMHTILVALSSGYDIKIESFRKFTLDTAKYSIELYPWFFMPPTVHKLLVHGPDVISSFLLPIGQLSEEAQEARNKDFKRYRESYSRKCSREKCNEDVFNLLLITSDPVITSYRQLPKKKLNSFPKEVFELIIPPDVTMSDTSVMTESEDSSSSESES